MAARSFKQTENQFPLPSDISNWTSEKEKVPDRQFCLKARESVPTPLGRHARNPYLAASRAIAKWFL
jgi:hypothetical protein